MHPFSVSHIWVWRGGWNGCTVRTDWLGGWVCEWALVNVPPCCFSSVSLLDWMASVPRYWSCGWTKEQLPGWENGGRHEEHKGITGDQSSATVSHWNQPQCLLFTLSAPYQSCIIKANQLLPITTASHEKHSTGKTGNGFYCEAGTGNNVLITTYGTESAIVHQKCIYKTRWVIFGIFFVSGSVWVFCKEVMKRELFERACKPPTPLQGNQLSCAAWNQMVITIIINWL